VRGALPFSQRFHASIGVHRFHMVRQGEQMFRSILVPVDAGEASEKALTFALDLAAAQRADVWICHTPVRSTASRIGSHIPFSRDAAETQWDDALRSGRAILDVARDRADEYGVRAKTALGAGLPADAIVEFAERESVDLIVMGSNGNEGPMRGLVSSTTDAVIRRAPVPVVVVGPDAAWLEAAPLSAI
jgi:nucleotide-binding universal stress UspA family protein